jgi:hypothetical protein
MDLGQNMTKLRGAIFLSIGNTFIGSKINEKKVSSIEFVIEVNKYCNGSNEQF